MPSKGPGPRQQFRLPRDIAAGVFLCLVAAGAYLGVSELPISDASGIGPGLVPKAVTAGMAALGMAIAAAGLGTNGERLDRLSLRGPIFVLGAVALFAASIRPLGLAVAGPLAVFVAGLADREARPVGLAVFACVLSALCIGLFKYVLRLPIPLAPFLIGY